MTALDVLQSDPWRWWSYNDVAKAVGKAVEFAAVHQDLLALARNPASVEGRKTDKSKFKYNLFRVLPKGVVPIGDATKAARLMKSASWICAYVRDHPGLSANKILAATSAAMGSIHRQEGLALIKLMETCNFLIRDDQGKLHLSPPEFRQVAELRAAVRTWYETHRTPRTTSGSYLVPNTPQTGSKGGSNGENA